MEQIIAPIEGAAQRLLPGGQIARTAGQQVQAGTQARQHGRRGQQLDTRSRQFDGQRQTIQAMTNLRHRRRVLIGQVKTRAGSPRPLDEQPDRFVVAEVLRRRSLGTIRQLQGRDRVLVLGSQVQRRPAGRQYL